MERTDINVERTDTNVERTDINDVVFLENTRLIYAGVDIIYKLCQAKNPNLNRELKDAEAKIRETVESQWEACFPRREIARRPEESNVRYQNPLHRFFRFLLDEQVGYISDNDECMRVCQDEAVEMVRLYHIITYLQTETVKEKYPESFESLCDCMRDIMKCKVCYLLYSQRDQTELLSMSSFPEEMVSSQLKQMNYDKLRTMVKNARSSHEATADSKETRLSLADTLYVPEETDKTPVAIMVLNYPRYPEANRKGEWIYIVFQYKDKADINSLLQRNKGDLRQRYGMLTRARNLLFLRQHILDQCIQKLHILLLGQRSYQYVSQLSKGEQIRILHLTDLHLQRSNRAAALEFAKNINKAVGLNEPVDLLVITGDIAQSNASAGLLEENYGYADEFVRTIAVSLWKKENGNVRSDWQKRVIIIPGNHDYASMNELQATFVPGAKRATGGGYPARNEGGPMVKFAYYIGFVCRLLGLDMDNLIENDLNELRNYWGLGLTVLSLNTVSKTGPLRTNKVLLDMDAIENFPKAVDADGQFQLILGHHGPNYEPDYLMDRYWFYHTDVTMEMQKDWIERFRKCLNDVKKHFAGTPLSVRQNKIDVRPPLGEEQDTADTQIGEVKQLTIDTQLQLEEEQIEIIPRTRSLSEQEKEEAEAWYKEKRKLYTTLSQLKNEIVNAGEFDVNKPEKNDLLWDIVRTLNALPEDTLSEQIAALHTSVNGDYDMTIYDRTLFRDGYERLLKKNGFFLSLAGHTHTLNLGGNDINGANLKDVKLADIPFVEGDQMINDKKFSIGLVTIDKDKRTIKWQMKVSPKKDKTHRDMSWKY